MIQTKGFTVAQAIQGLTFLYIITYPSCGLGCAQLVSCLPNMHEPRFELQHQIKAGLMVQACHPTTGEVNYW